VYSLYFYAPWFYMDALFCEKDWLDDRHFSTFFTSQRLHLSSKELKCIFPEKVAQIQGYHKFLFYTYPFIFFTESFWSQVSYFVRKWSESHLIKKRLFTSLGSARTKTACKYVGEIDAWIKNHLLIILFGYWYHNWFGAKLD